MAYLLHVSSGDDSGSQTQRKPGHTGCRSIASRPCEFLYVSLGFLPRKMPFHTEGRGRASLLCVFYCVSSGYWTG